jgi:Tfp pilus assembly protein PilX
MIKMKLKKVKNNRGFVLLFAVTLAAIFLSIALGASQIALKENNFSTSAKDTNNAFYAADTGSEQALYSDDSYVPTSSGVITSSFLMTGLGSNGTSCANVSVTKTNIQNPDSSFSTTATSIVSKGYNIGSGAGVCNPPANAVERELDTTY